MKTFVQIREEFALHEDAVLMKHHQSMMKKHASARDDHVDHAERHKDDNNYSERHAEAGQAHNFAHDDHKQALSMLKKHGKDHSEYKSAAQTANSTTKSVKSDHGT